MRSFKTFTPHKYNQNIHIKDVYYKQAMWETGGGLLYTWFWLCNMKERENMQDSSIDGRIIL